MLHTPSRSSPGLSDDPALLQQVDRDPGAGYPTTGAKRHLQELSEARRVAVDPRAGITERLHDRVGGQDALLDPPPTGLAQGDQLAQQVVGGLGLPGTALPGDHHTLVLSAGTRGWSLVLHRTNRAQRYDCVRYA